MDNLIINGKSVELKFTFNSFKYMADFDLAELDPEVLQGKPFKLAEITEQLMYGAVNSKPSTYISPDEVNEFLEGYVAENSLAELLDDLMGKLEKSNFFKSLQKTVEPQKPTRKK